MADLLQALYVYFISPILLLVMILIFAWVVMSWLVSFNVVDIRNPTARQIVHTLNRVVDPIMAPVRRLIPPIGGTLDLSPVLVLLGLSFLKDWFFPRLFCVWLA